MQNWMLRVQKVREQFQQSFGTLKLLLSLVYVCVCISKQQVLTPLYRGVKDTLEIVSTSKKSRLKLDQITHDLLSDMVIVLRRINFKSIPSLEEHWCMHSCYSCLVADTDRVVEIVVVHFVQLYFVNSLQRKSIQCIQIHLNQPLLRSSILLQ